MGMLFLADAGVPMLFLQVPALAILLVPVIAIEAVIGWRSLNLPKKRITWGVAIANLITTFIGFPIVWFVWLALQLFVLGGNSSRGMKTLADRVFAVTVQAPWLVPYEAHLDWMVPTAALVLMIPTFFVSVYVERWFCRWYWKCENRELLSRTFWRMHVASYALLFVCGLLLLAYNLHAAR